VPNSKLEQLVINALPIFIIFIFILTIYLFLLFIFFAYFCYPQQHENWPGSAYSIWEAIKKIEGGRVANGKIEFRFFGRQLLEIC